VGTPLLDEYLEHHGIKGMRWGVRRFQNKDGTLTAAGKRRYDVDIEKAKARVDAAKKAQEKAVAEYNRVTAGGMVYNQRASKKLEKANQKRDWANRQLSSEKVKEKLNNETGKKSKRRLSLELQYKEKGMSDEEAEIAAYKRVRTEKIIAATAGLTIAAAAAYVAYKHHDKSVDKIIKAGTELQNISDNSNKGVSDAFYFSMTKSDNTKYRGIYGKKISGDGRSVSETKLGVNKSMKVASEKSAVRALSDLVSGDSDYAKALSDHLNASVGRYTTPAQKRAIQNGVKSLNKGRIDTNVYNALNLTLVDHNLPTSSKVHSGFYNKLKSLGYDAIIDVNDKKYSGYMSSKPMIAFNAASKATVNRAREVGKEEIQRAAQRGMMNISMKSLAPTAAGVAGSAGLVYAGQKALMNRNFDAIVREYKKLHPKTDLSYDQIIDSYYGEPRR